MVIGALERLQNRMIQGATKQLGTVHPKGACAYSSGNINMDLIKNIYCIQQIAFVYLHISLQPLKCIDCLYIHCLCSTSLQNVQ